MVLAETIRSLAEYIASFITILRDIDAIIRHEIRQYFTRPCIVIWLTICQFIDIYRFYTNEYLAIETLFDQLILLVVYFSLVTKWGSCFYF